MKNILSKKQFVEILKTIQEDLEYSDRINNSLSDLLDDGGGFVKNESLNMLIKILCYLFDDSGPESDIDYFIWELDFGKKYYDGCFGYKDKNIDISSSEKLFDYLIENKPTDIISTKD